MPSCHSHICSQFSLYLLAIPYLSLYQKLSGITRSHILLVVFVSLFVDDIAAYLPQTILILADAAAVITGLLINPVYPPQAHFTSAEQLANNRRKNVLLCIIILAQCISSCVHDLRVFTGSFCGVLFAVFTAIIQITKNKKESQS